MTAMPEHWKSYFRALNPSTINGCGEGAWRSRRGSQVILEGNHDNPESGSHQRGLKFQNFFGQNALRPLPSPSHLKKGNNSPLLIKSVTLFRPAGYFNFCWNPCLLIFVVFEHLQMLIFIRKEMDPKKYLHKCKPCLQIGAMCEKLISTAALIRVIAA